MEINRVTQKFATSAPVYRSVLVENKLLVYEQWHRTISKTILLGKETWRWGELWHFREERLLLWKVHLEKFRLRKHGKSRHWHHRTRHECRRWRLHVRVAGHGWHSSVEESGEESCCSGSVLLVSIDSGTRHAWWTPTKLSSSSSDEDLILAAGIQHPVVSWNRTWEWTFR